MPVVASPSYGKEPTLSPWLVLLTPILVLLIYIGVVDNPLIGPGQELTELNPQVTGELRWREVWLNSTPAMERGPARYRPIFAALLRLEWRAWGASPSSYHSFSLILLVGLLGAGMAFFRLLAPAGLARTLAVLLLVIHPMLTESVLSVAGQGILLGLGLALGALVVVLLQRRGRIDLASATALVFVMAGLAYGCHEMALVLPLWIGVVLLLAPVPVPETTPARRRRGKVEAESSEPGRGRGQLAGMVLLLGGLIPAGFYLALRYQALDRMLPAAAIHDFMFRDVAAPAWLAAPAVVLAYLGRLLWPAHPTLFYEPAAIAGRWLLIGAGWVVLALLIGALIYCWRRRPPWALALGLLLPPLIGLSHWIPLSAFMSEMPLAFALPGFALLVSLALDALGQSVRLPLRGDLRRRAVAGVWMLAVAAMAWQAWRRGGEWYSADELYQAESARHPSDPAPRIERVRLAVLQGDIEQAEALVEEVTPLASPADLNRLARLRALLYEQTGRRDQLRQLMRDELESGRPPEEGHFLRLATSAHGERMRDKLQQLLEAELTAFPHSFEAVHELLRLELEDQEARPAGQRDWNRALDLADQMMAAAASVNDESRARAMALYGKTLANAGYLDEALQQLNQALRLDPGLYEPYLLRARIFWGRKEYQLAEDAIARAMLRARVSSYVDLAQLYVGILEDQGRRDHALNWLTGALRDYPGDMALYGYAARYFIAHARYDRAQWALERMAGVQGPMRADYYSALAALLWNRDRDLEGAISAARQALQINRRHPDALANLRLLEGVRDRREATPTPTPIATPAPTPVATPATDAVTTAATTAARHADAMTPAPQVGAGPPPPQARVGEGDAGTGRRE
ncbi:MAG TPA: hypothetical protein PLG73_10865 [Candidatus Sumerlaeota bacterium]|nr:hypothetical protein [Candidatus Sumerlaeota bacterium]